MDNRDLQKVAPDINLYWLHDHRIAVFEIRTVARTSWDGWLKTMMDLKRDWPTDRPFLTLHDNLYPGAGFTPTIKNYSTQVTHYRTEIAQYSAVILPKTIVAQMVTLFMRSNRDPNGQARVLFSIPEGLAWLESHLAEQA